jgi:hypothetical protein
VLRAEDERAQDQQIEGALKQYEPFFVLGGHPTQVCIASGRLSTRVQS